MGRILNLEELSSAIAGDRAAGRRVVLTNGCFDLLHVGHVRLLAQSRALGDVLVVGVNADESVQRLKGPTRPILPAVERAEIVAALASVDYVTVFPEPTAERLAAIVRPDVYVKGADYAVAATPADHADVSADVSADVIDHRRLPEASTVRAGGGKVVLLPLTPDRSTSAIVERIRAAGGEPVGTT
jgi:D-glycero-beta-D-manno-heptose 1-phosphate adenylyltransferase